jgi:hypothetical protein
MSKGGTILNDKDTLGGVAGAIKWDGNRAWIYCYVAASVAQGTPLVLTYDGDEESNPKTAAPANLAVYQLIVFCPELTAAAGFYWCQFRGDAEILVDGTTNVAKDDFLEVINGGVALIYDATTVKVGSVAIAQEARTTDSAGLCNVYLLGFRVIVAAA